MVFNILFDIQDRKYMSVLPQASLFLGIIPALFIMYICLKGYDNYYKEKNVFLIFVAGIFMGFVSSFVQYGMIPLETYAIFPTTIIFIISFPIIDQLAKTIVLNIGRFQQKKETPIYGMSLGLGFGSSFTPIMLIVASASNIISNDFYVLGTIALGSLGLILFHAGTAIYIGYGIFEKTLTRNLLIAMLLQIPFNFLVGLMLNYSNIYSVKCQIGFSVAIILYGFILFYYVNKNLLPKIRKKRKEVRSDE